MSTAGNAVRTPGGFTLIEVLVATATAAVLSALLLTMWLQAAQTSQRAESERRLAALRDVLAQHYRDQSLRIDARTDAVFAIGPGAAGEIVVQSGADLDAAALAPLQARFALPLVDASRDGWGTPFRLFVTAPLAGQVDGVPVIYRQVAIVSAGRNQRFDGGTWDAAAGTLVTAGDDRAALIDGLAIVRPQVQETRRRMLKLAGLISGFAAARYIAHPARDVNIDYFAGMPAGSGDAPWDDAPDNALLRRTVKTQPGLSAAELGALGVSATEARDAWGGPIDFDNDGPDVRHPDNPLPAMRTPPYTARLIATLPGGGQLVESVFAAY